MRAGELQHRVTFEQSTETQSDSGATTATWASVHSRWCKVEPLSGNELFRAQQVNPLVRHKITLRYAPWLKEHMRGRFQGRYLNVEAITHTDEKGNETIALCTEESEP